MSLALKLAAVMGGASAGGGAKTYAKWDSTRSVGFTLSNDDLTATNSGAGYKCCFVDQLKDSGKHYFEVTIESATQEHQFMICDSAHLSNSYAGNTTGPYGKFYGAIEGGNGLTNGVNTFNATLANGRVICGAFDMDNKKVWFGADGAYVNGGDPATGANPMFTWSGDFSLGFAYQMYYNNHVVTLNSGETAFAHSVPAGFNEGLYTE